LLEVQCGSSFPCKRLEEMRSFLWYAGGFLSGIFFVAVCVLSGPQISFPAPEDPVFSAFIPSMPEKYCVAKITYLDPNEADHCVAWRYPKKESENHSHG
jgi:hypothetical protein